MRTAVVACACAVAACTHYARLDTQRVLALEVRAVGTDGATAPRLCARGGLVDVFATTADGVRYEEGVRTHRDRRHFDPALVRLSASIGELHDRSWNPPPDPFALLGASGSGAAEGVTITAMLVSNPAVSARATFQPTWACDPPTAYVAGHDGAEGGFGATGGPGGAGAPGGNGGRGGDGYATTVSIAWLARPTPGGQRLAIARVQTRGLGEQLFVLDATTPLEVLANGGAGGAGGTGGFGGASDSGVSGPGGRGGDGGAGGAGGAVTVRYDAAAPELQKLLHVENHGGAGGAHGYAGGGGIGAVTAMGASGDNGSPGPAGADGPPVVFEPSAGLADELTAIAARRTGSAGPAVATTPPPAVTAPPPSATIAPAADGAREYTGESVVVVTAPGQRATRQQRSLLVESTRTRAYHFTIRFGDDRACRLDFHRPPDEPAFRYALDAPVACAVGGVRYEIASATLDLDPPSDHLVLVWDGTGRPPAGAPPLALHSFFAGARR